MTMLSATPLPASADTTDIYLIDGNKVMDFNGTQLSGKTIATYTIAHSLDRPERVHIITTTEATGAASTLTKSAMAYVIDGNKVSEEQFNQLKPSEIKSMTVLKDKDSLKKYGAGNSGTVVVVSTKKRPKTATYRR